MAIHQPPYTENSDLDVFNKEVADYINNSTSPGFASRRSAPSSSSANGGLGEMRFDANWLYVCVDVSGTLTWKRIALTTF